jgi:site-specific recombinase XerD
MRSYARFNRGLVDQYYKWMIAMHYAKVTKRVYLKALHQYLNFMGERSLARADHTDIRLFIADASENGATLDAVYRNLGILRQFYDFLNLGGVVDYVAPRFVRLRRPWRGRPGTLTEAQIKRLISVTQTPRERALVEFFYSSGCRLSEALHLKIENVDLVARQARVRGKLGKVRLVLLAESAAQAVRAYIGERDSGYLFEADYRPQKGHLGGYDGQWKSKWIQLRKRDGKSAQQTKILGSIARMSYEEAKQKHEALMATRNLSLPKRTRPLSKVVVQHLVASIARRAGLRNFTPHTFRRTFATHLHENGANLEVIRALLGHVWIQTTLRYARIGPDGLSKNFEKCHPLGNRHEITSNSRHFDPTNTSDYEPYFLRRAREECAAATLVPAAASCFRYPWAGSHRLPTKDAERF